MRRPYTLGRFGRTSMADVFLGVVRKKMKTEGRDFDKEVEGFKNRAKDAAIKTMKAKLTK